MIIILLNVYIFLSIVLEMVPMSSSSHIYFFLEYAKKKYMLVPNELTFAAFDFLVHGVTLIVVAFFLRRRFLLLVRKMCDDRNWAAAFLMRGFIVEIVTVLFFLLFHSLQRTPFFFGIGFAITTFFLFVDRWLPVAAKREWSWYEPVLIGCAQGIAFLPGVSRLAITYGVARLFSFSRRHAFEFSFLIEAPISAAAFFKGLHDLYQLRMLDLLNLQTCLIMVIAGVVAYVVLACMYRVALAGWWYLFGYYTALLTLVLFLG